LAMDIHHRRHRRFNTVATRTLNANPLISLPV
jgi:hypothetical protein